MKAGDLISAGDRAKRHLRVAQALAHLSKIRTPSLSQVKEALAKVQGNQPAVAMAVIMEYSKRNPLHLRGEWLRAADEALQLYRLSDDADQKEAELARDRIKHEINAYNAEMDRIETLRERLSMGVLLLLVLLLAGGLIYIGYAFSPKPEGEETKTVKPGATEAAETKKADAKAVAGKPDNKKPDSKHEPEKTPAGPSKKTETDGKASKPAGK
jgi:hypothetical protein